jgi:UDP-N-acetylglucosamine/UDP-N-acetylgalactosamine diphosphorylase
LFSVPFLERVTARGTGLRYHVARKKVEHYDPARGRVVKPDTENALKFEMFIFDALPMAERWLAVETPRAEEFAPVKNATGADTPEQARRAISQLHATWLEVAGVTTAGHTVEVSAFFALDVHELTTRIPPGFAVTGPTHLK